MSLKTETILPGQPHHQAVLVWHSDGLFCLEAYVIAWKLLPDHAEPVFAEDINTCTAILLRGPDGLLSDLSGTWGTYPNLDAFKADYQTRTNRKP